MAQKRCCACKLTLPLLAYAKDASRKDKHSSRCRACDNARKYVDAVTGHEPRLTADIIAGGETLASYGTPIERACAESLIRAGSITAAAASLQLEPSQLRAHLHELRRKAASRGYAPGQDMTKSVPDGYRVKGVSTLYDGDGAVRAQWVKSSRDEEHKLAALLDAMSHIADTWQGLADPTPAPQTSNADLLCVYPMGDPHIGMHSWAAETGNNFDLKIAEHNLVAAVDHLVSMAPPADHALIADVGDFHHADGKLNQTTAGTPVDVDGRWPKVFGVGLRLMRRCIDRALERHKHVTVFHARGNHNDHTAIMLAVCLAQYYEREPRVTIDTSPGKFLWHRFGANLIGVTHGDTVKLAELGEIMACDRPQDWAETQYRYWLTGHIHHDTVKELRGCIVESFRTLAPGDAWHHGKGYRSGRDMKVLVFDRTRGQILRHTVGIATIESEDK